jgi:hypothetical protein
VTLADGLHGFIGPRGLSMWRWTGHFASLAGSTEGGMMVHKRRTKTAIEAAHAAAERGNANLK